MNADALQRLNDAEAALAAALNSPAVETLEAATYHLAETLDEVRAQGGWNGRVDLRARIAEALKAADLVRGRINAHADRNRRQLDRLISLAGNPRAQAYRRDGRLG